MDRSGWKITSTKNEHGAPISDREILMKRPDGQPCNVQEMYKEHYQGKGYVLADSLDFDDVIPTKQPTKKATKAEMRKLAYGRHANALKINVLKKELDLKDVEYSEDAKKPELVDLYIAVLDAERIERMKPNA